MKISFIYREVAPHQVFNDVTRLKDLQATFQEHVRKGQVRGRDGCVPEALADRISSETKLISTRLRSGRYRFTHYRELVISRGAGKTPRVLSIPTARDRIALRAIADLLGRVFPLTKSALASRKIADVARFLEINVADGRPFDTYIRLDVQNFYPRIRHDDIRAQLRKKVRKHEIVDVIMQAVQTPTIADRSPAGHRTVVGVPQGLAISNALAELVAQPIDQAVKVDPRCAYFRYVDDILVFCESRHAGQLAKMISEQFRQRGLTVHPLRKGSKSSKGPITRGFDFLGYTFKDTGKSDEPIRVSVRKSSVSAIEGRLTRIFSNYRKLRDLEPERALLRCELQLNLAIAGCIFDNNPRGWLPYYRQLNDLTLLKHLDSMTSMLGKRYNVPSSFRPKKFVRAYWALRYPHGRDAAYIRSYDDLNTQEQREILKILIGLKDAALVPAEQVPSMFKKEMNHLVSDLEHDIGDRS